MSIYSQAAFTPLTAQSPALRPGTALTREQTLSFDNTSIGSPHVRAHSPVLQLATTSQDAAKWRYSIPEDTEIGTSSKPLNELVHDIRGYGGAIYVHRVSRLLKG